MKTRVITALVGVPILIAALIMVFVPTVYSFVLYKKGI